MHFHKMKIFHFACSAESDFFYDLLSLPLSYFRCFYCIPNEGGWALLSVINLVLTSASLWLLLWRMKKKKSWPILTWTLDNKNFSFLRELLCVMTIRWGLFEHRSNNKIKSFGCSPFTPVVWCETQTALNEEQEKKFIKILTVGRNNSLFHPATEFYFVWF